MYPSMLIDKYYNKNVDSNTKNKYTLREIF